MKALSSNRCASVDTAMTTGWPMKTAGSTSAVDGDRRSSLSCRPAGDQLPRAAPTLPGTDDTVPPSYACPCLVAVVRDATDVANRRLADSGVGIDTEGE